MYTTVLESQADISYWLNQTPDSYFFISSDTSCFCAHILLHVLQQSVCILRVTFQRLCSATSVLCFWSQAPWFGPENKRNCLDVHTGTLSTALCCWCMTHSLAFRETEWKPERGTEEREMMFQRAVRKERAAVIWKMKGRSRELCTLISRLVL